MEEDTRVPLGLPPVPPSSDPQRLLAYVLQVLPQYTSMELSTTHYRLYTQQLRTEVDRWKQYAAGIDQRLSDEEDKRVFMERYAAEVVKERNEVLHHKGAKKHKLWHNCCRQHASYDLDVTPSIVSLRGEKLTECTIKLRQAQVALKEKERLLDAAQELLNTKQIDFDAFVSASRKEKEQLEHQLAMRSGLQGSQERRLAEAERLVWEDKQTIEKKNKLIDQLHDRLDTLDQKYAQLENQLMSKEEQIASLESENQALERSLTDTQDQLEAWQQAAHEKDIEIESLHGQVEALSTADLQALQQRYSKQIESLVAQHEAQIRAYEAQIQQVRAEPSPRTPQRDFINSFQKRMTLDEISSDSDKPLLSPSYFQQSEQSMTWGVHSNPSPGNSGKNESTPSSLRQSHRGSVNSTSPANVQRRLITESVSSSSSHRTPDRNAISNQLHALLQESEERRKLEESKAKEDRAMLDALKQRLSMNQSS
ncbi:hypothetical protein THRCLA_22416 [Thraustotheca clavata]|uniref:Uncharacterized protein n=1 Tax=Thraustotheca clavata TaxID=74557 RepID=A0A1V9Z241_9STRA|nr:hypothetical protein THRCLA_22416 [Thraustotheca clavata]